MIDDVSAIIPPPAEHVVTPPLELPPVGESITFAPTIEQTQIADRVFSDASQRPNAAASLFGVVTSAMLLRDLAVDTFDTTGEEEEEEQKPTEPRP